MKAVKTPERGRSTARSARSTTRAARASRSCSRAAGPLVYYAFDLLELDGEPLVDLPLGERKERLRELLDKRAQVGRFSESFDDGDALLEAAREQRLEGIIAKRVESPYQQGKRTRDWLKIKTQDSEEFVVAGYTRGAGRRAGTFGSLVLAVNDGDELRYVGNVGTGLQRRRDRAGC